ncbi:hypothetical protein AU476_02465 [Cupriavidus sp. UYMSc13B]|nr:hypothetical protein AU476_02465 [Cupriavidus sp. UYMSc13B]
MFSTIAIDPSPLPRMSAVPPTPSDPSDANWRIDAGALRGMLSPALSDWTLELVEEPAPPMPT